MSQKNTQDIKNDIQGLGGFLKKAEKELEDLKDKVAIIVDARAGFTQNLSTYFATQINATHHFYPTTKKIYIHSTFLKMRNKILSLSSSTTLRLKTTLKI